MQVYVAVTGHWQHQHLPSSRLGSQSHSLTLNTMIICPAFVKSQWRVGILGRQSGPVGDLAAGSLGCSPCNYNPNLVDVVMLSAADGTQVFHTLPC